MRSLNYYKSALATYGGLSYLLSLFFELDELLPMQIEFTYEGCTIYVHYYSSLINGRIHLNVHLLGEAGVGGVILDPRGHPRP